MKTANTPRRKQTPKTPAGRLSKAAGVPNGRGGPRRTRKGNPEGGPANPPGNPKLRRNANTLYACELRRKLLYPLWANFYGAREASRTTFEVELPPDRVKSLKTIGWVVREGDKPNKYTVGPFAFSTIRGDYAHIEREAAEDAERAPVRDRVINSYGTTVRQADEAINKVLHSGARVTVNKRTGLPVVTEGLDASGLAALLKAKVAALDAISRVSGLITGPLLPGDGLPGPAAGTPVTVREYRWLPGNDDPADDVVPPAGGNGDD